jgi:hypothetical protein
MITRWLKYLYDWTENDRQKFEILPKTKVDSFQSCFSVPVILKSQAQSLLDDFRQKYKLHSMLYFELHEKNTINSSVLIILLYDKQAYT